MNHIYAVDIRPSPFFKVHLNIILPSTPLSSEWSRFFEFPQQNPVSASHLPQKQVTIDQIGSET